jgi:hypothetical protein
LRREEQLGKLTMASDPQDRKGQCLPEGWCRGQGCDGRGEEGLSACQSGNGKATGYKVSNQ